MSYVFDWGARAADLIPFLLAGFALEATASAAERRGVTISHRRFNLACVAVYLLADMVTAATLTVLVQRLTWSLPGAGLLGHVLPAPHAPLAIVVLAYGWVIMGDFFYYWVHRAQHTIPWLWAEHEIHHADDAINVTTTLRHHWLEKPLEAVAIVGPLAYLFQPPIAVAVAAGVLRNGIGHFIHANVRIGFGRWHRLLASPQHHRLHHSVERQHFDVNFAAYFPLWDVLFGTYYQAADDEYPATGVRGVPSPTTLWAMSAHPFKRWLAMWRSGRRRHHLERP